MIRFVHLRLFVYLRLMSWKHLQGLFQIHIINYLVILDRTPEAKTRATAAKPFGLWMSARQGLAMVAQLSENGRG